MRYSPHGEWCGSFCRWHDGRNEKVFRNPSSAVHLLPIHGEMACAEEMRWRMLDEMGEGTLAGKPAKW